MVISPGADPSQELQELADSVVGSDHYHQVAMGQGQADIAIQLLRDCSIKGEWMCLKNLHLVTTWLLTLEKELNALEPHENFRLWLTTESHPKFPTILLQSSLKVTYEAPPGIKKNLERTYDSWSQEYVAQGSVVYGHKHSFSCMVSCHGSGEEVPHTTRMVQVLRVLFGRHVSSCHYH